MCPGRKRATAGGSDLWCNDTKRARCYHLDRRKKKFTARVPATVLKYNKHTFKTRVYLKFQKTTPFPGFSRNTPGRSAV